MVLTCTGCGVEYSPKRRPKANTQNTFCSRDCKNRWAIDSGKNYEYQRRSRLKRRYGITVEAYDQLRANQINACAICGRTDPNGRVSSWTADYWLHVDHCHDTGEVRGLLCHGCNVSLGHFQHDPALLRRAIEYLSS